MSCEMKPTHPGLRRHEERVERAMQGDMRLEVEHTPGTEVKIRYGSRGYRQPRSPVVTTTDKVLKFEFFGA